MKKIFIISITAIIIFISIGIAGFYFMDQDASQLKIWKGSSQKDTVNITYITDKNYIFPLMISIRSGIQNKNPESKYHYFVIGVELPKDDILKLEALSQKNVQVTVLNQPHIYKDKEVYYKYKKLTDNTPMKTDLFKFNIPNIFPKIDKLLYLDCDTIVQKDLSRLFATDVDDVYAGVIGEISQNNRLPQTLKLPYYFNAGVFLFNLKNMRQDEIGKKLYNYKFGPNPGKRFMTQDAFNTVLYPKYIRLSAQYNTLTAWFRENKKKELFKYYDIDENKYPTVKDYVYDATILHFIMKKPWKDKTVPYAELWLKYLTDEEREQTGL